MQTHADLDINKLDNPDPVDRGDFLVYTLEVTNEGSEKVSDGNLQVIDNLPLSRVDFDSVDANEFRCEFRGGSVQCKLRSGETLGAGEAEEIDIVVEAEETGTAQNTAIVRAHGNRVDSSTESTRIEDNGNSGGGGSGGGNGGGDGGVGITQTPNDTGTASPTDTGIADPATADATDDTVTEDAVTTDALEGDGGGFADREGSFRWDSFLRVVRDEDGALRGQYLDGRGDDELVVQRFEQCLEADVLADTIPDRTLPFTGGPSLPAGGGMLLLVAGAALALRMIRR